MKRSRSSAEQIAYALRQAEGGTALADVCRQLSISDAIFFVWKKKCGALGATELRELRLLRQENAKLKRLVADLTLDKHILGEIRTKNKSKAGTQARDRGLGVHGLWNSTAARLLTIADFARSVRVHKPPPESGAVTQSDERAGHIDSSTVCDVGYNVSSPIKLRSGSTPIGPNDPQLLSNMRMGASPALPHANVMADHQHAQGLESALRSKAWRIRSYNDAVGYAPCISAKP